MLLGEYKVTGGRITVPAPWMRKNKVRRGTSVVISMEDDGRVLKIVKGTIEEEAAKVTAS
jgi:bifunctional DNA-binding transcriptional regulator/antitoxin component of YhaV-PrlF toxin-antitoxin module